MSLRYNRRYVGPLKAVVLDWAGTAIDHGCMAPSAIFMQAFSDFGVPITAAQARAPMGMAKWHHIQAVTQMAPVAAAWQAVKGKLPDDSDVDALYAHFLPLQVKTVAAHSDVIAGVAETVAALRARGLAIASTTGYPREVMGEVFALAAAQGYAPDIAICAGETPLGRPGPYMALKALVELSISPVEAVVKVGDTVVDIEEGLNAGMWSVGISTTGNEVGLTAADYAALPVAEQRQRTAAATEKLYAAGAHYVIERLSDVLPILDRIEARLAAGEKP